MATARATICNKKGLHARAAAKLVKTAATYDARVEIIRLPRAGEEPDPAAKAGATSILSLLMLAAERGVDIELSGEGAQAQEAISAIVALVERKFDEEE
ncbi:MAG: HPr family phosphocarrier protein [Rickettsiales bacterium]